MANKKHLTPAGIEKLNTWIPVDLYLPNGSGFDWVLVRCEFVPEGGCALPHIAEMRNGVWYSTEYERPLESEAGVKVTHWRPLPSTDVIPIFETKSPLVKWAEKEIEIACKREKKNAKDDDWDYGTACYESALKAFKSLTEDGHSGMSISFTKSILMRLIDGKPLTPIEEKARGTWTLAWTNKGVKTYQNKRMSSLFKDVYKDGTVTYSDNNRYYCQDVNDPDNTWTGGMGRKILNEMFPISMPYYPTEKYVVYCDEFLTDLKHGAYDTVCISSIKCPDGLVKPVNRYFKAEDDWIEITQAEFDERKKRAIKR